MMHHYLTLEALETVEAELLEEARMSDLRWSRIPAELQVYLRWAGVTSSRQIDAMSDRDLMRIRRIGAKSVAVIRAAIAGKDVPAWKLVNDMEGK